MSRVALRIVNEVSCAMGINHEKAQYLVRLEHESCCSAQCI